MGSARRQTAALDDLVARARRMSEIEAVVLIGSLASDTADAMSDVDAIIVVEKSSLAAARGHRHRLHDATAIVCWDHPAQEHAADVVAHKWIDENGVLVEVLLAAASGPVRVADPARVVLGDPAVLSRMRRRPPIRREEMTDEVHPIEAAYDQLKQLVRTTS